MGLYDKLPLNRLAVQKACSAGNVVDLTVLPNSQLPIDQAERFIDMLVDESRLLNNVRTLRVNNCRGRVNKLDLCSIVTEGASTTSCVISSVPEEATMEWNTEKYRASFAITSDFLECNLERARGRDTILNMFTKAMRRDMETAAIRGDASLATGDAQTRLNNLLGVNDGWSKLLNDCTPTCQIIDAAGASPSKYLYYEMKRRIPTKYRSGIDSYRFVAPPSAVDKHSLDWTNRDTATGDAALAGAGVPAPWGIPFFEVPLMPEDIQYNSEDSFEMWLTPLQNLVLVIQRDFRVEEQRVPKLDRSEIVVHYKMDVMVENPELVVLAKNLTSCGPDYTACSEAGPCSTCE